MPRHALELAPFQGLRYISPDVDRFVDDEFDIARLLAPPYDIPGAQEARELQHSDPHNAARVTLPFELGRESHPRYRKAAQLLHSWIEEGVLAQDDAPALYVYEQTAPDGTHQRGLIGALDLDSPVRPHEEVAEPPVRDRFRLMRATRANLEPIFLVYRGRDGAASKATQEVDGTPLASATLRDGSSHHLWAITEPAVLERIGTDLSRRSALIADGHHRYAAYRQLLREDPDLGWRHGLALLVDSDTHPPHLGAIHRVLPGVDIEQALDLANTVAEVVPSDTTTPQDGLLLLSPKGHGHLVHNIDPRTLAEAMPDRSSEWRNLPTAALHEILLPLWGVPEEQVRMVHDDPDQAMGTARETQGIAVIVPPLSVEQVYAVADRGELTPRKSTSFGPKPRTGLVMRILDTPPRKIPLHLRKTHTMPTAPTTLQTRTSLAAELTHLGVTPGDILLVHSSLRALGWVCGGQETVVQALIDAVGPHGTVTVPTQCGEQSDPARWGNPPVPQEWWDEIRRSMPPYDPDRTPTTFMGRIPELLRTWPGAVRSDHPQTSFAALGVHARELMHPHPLSCRLGEESPLGRLARTQAKVLFLGTDYNTCTAFHLAEYRLPTSPTETEGASVSDPEHGAAWVTYTDIALNEEDFPHIGSAFEETGAVTVGRVGQALARLFPLAEAVDFATEWMLSNRVTGPIT